jgi:hypothetical protein
MDLPASAGSSRDQAILSAIRSSNYSVPWATITSDIPGHHGEFRITADALKVEEVRINVSAYLQQQIADLLSCMLLTAKLADLIWLQRSVTLPPFPQPTTNMSSTAAMVQASTTIDQALAAQGNPQGIIATVGKNWVLDNALLQPNGAPVLKSTGRPAACNYGWHFATPTFQGQKWDPCASGLPGCRLIQGRGTAHDLGEVDYSQICLLVARSCFVDGVSMDLAQVVQDPVLAPLATLGTPLRLTRQPGVPELLPISQPPCVGPGCPELASTGASSLTSSSWGGPLLMFAGGFLGGMALRHMS